MPKGFAAKERKTTQLDENLPGQGESKRIKTENDSDDDWFGILTWIRSSMPTRF